MILYFVPVAAVDYKDKNHKLIVVSPDDILTPWAAKRFDGNKHSQIAVYDNEADAIEVARQGVEPDDIAQYPVITLNTDLTQEELTILNVNPNSIQYYAFQDKVITNYAVPAHRCTPVKASFCYIDKEAKEISLEEAVKELRQKAAQEKATLNETRKLSEMGHSLKKETGDFKTKANADQSFVTTLTEYLTKEPEVKVEVPDVQYNEKSSQKSLRQWEKAQSEKTANKAKGSEVVDTQISKKRKTS